MELKSSARNDRDPAQSFKSTQEIFLRITGRVFLTLLTSRKIYNNWKLVGY